MRLLAVKDVRTRLALTDDDGINEVISSALEGTSISFEAELDTLFDKATKSDIFCTNGREYLAQDGYLRLKLRNGFVRPTPAVVVRWAAVDPQLLATGEVIPSAECRFDYERGFILVPFDPVADTGYSGYFQVDYDFGFLDIDEVPPWLKEAALGYAVKVMSMQQVSDKKDEKLSSIYGFIGRHGAGIMDRHLRTHARAIPALL